MASAHGARTAATWGSNVLNDNQAQVLGQLDKGYDTSKNYLQQGLDTGLGYLGQQQQTYAGMQMAGQPGLDRYTALTTGDPASMQTALENTPGYQFSLGQGLDALNRRRAAGGMLNSGNADADAITLGSGLASQTLTQERNALQPLLGLYSQGAQGQAGAYGNMANLASGTYGAQAGLGTDYYTSRANAYDDTAKGIVGLGSQALLAGDQAKSQNQANMVNAGMGLVKGFTSLFSGGMGGLGGAMKLGG